MIGLGREGRSILRSLIVAWIALFTCFMQSNAQSISADRLSAVLSGMGSKESVPDFDAVLSAMGSHEKGEMNLDGILAGMGAKETDESFELDGVLTSMNITKSLNYLDNLYSSSKNSGYDALSFFAGAKNGANRAASLISGHAVLPIRGRVTSRFGFRPSFGRMHHGIDIALQVGDTIVAAMDGRVERVSIDPKGYGIFVCLDHANGLKTRYAHLCSTLVTPGMYVRAGEPIALGGNTGNSTGPHLHFETRINDTAMDPARFFDFSSPVNVAGYGSWASYDAKVSNYGMSGYNSVNSGGMSSTAFPGDYQKRTYVVKAGDTLSSVARKTGVSVNSLCRLNMLSSSDSLEPGRMLKLK